MSKKLNDYDFQCAVASSVAEGGWSSLFSLVSKFPIDKLRAYYSWIEEEDEDEEEEVSND